MEFRGQNTYILSRFLSWPIVEKMPEQDVPSLFYCINRSELRVVMEWFAPLLNTASQ